MVVRVCGRTLRSHGRGRCMDEFCLTSGYNVMGAGRKGGVAVSRLEVFSSGAVGRDFRGP